MSRLAEKRHLKNPRLAVPRGPDAEKDAHGVVEILENLETGFRGEFGDKLLKRHKSPASPLHA
jgi:hypothetical protein